jgi:large subunit ribosomal protein L13
MESYKDRLARRPEDLILHAVRRMLPKNKLARHMLDKLKVYAGPEHPHQAQQVESIELGKKAS